MLISNLSNLPTYWLANTQQPEHKLMGWTLKWQQKHLIVTQKPQSERVSLEFADEQRLRECLQKSPIKIIQIDPTLGLVNLTIWATACKYAKKPMYLRAGKAQKLHHLYPLRWRLKRACDFLAAVILLLILSPVIFSLITWQRVKSPQSPLFTRQWRVGKRGRIFELLKFNFSAPGRTYYWQNLPQLLNVLRGEMSIVGAQPWTLAEVASVPQKQLNALPGLTGIPEKIATPLSLDDRSIYLADLNSWSLSRDLIILLQTMPKFFSGNID